MLRYISPRHINTRRIFPRPTTIDTPPPTSIHPTSHITHHTSKTRHTNYDYRRGHALQYLAVEDCPIHHAAAENDPLGGSNEHQAGAQAGERVGGRLPDRVLVRDLGQVFPWAVLLGRGSGDKKKQSGPELKHSMPAKANKIHHPVPPTLIEIKHQHREGGRPVSKATLRTE